MRKILGVVTLGMTAMCILVATAECCYAYQQSTPSDTRSTPLQEFFEGIRNHPNSLPTWDDYEKKVESRITELSPDEVTKALPVVVSVSKENNAEVRRYAVAALVGISTRPDSAQLLRGYINAIAALLDCPEDYAQRSALGIFALLKPRPPAEVFPHVLGFLKRTDRDPRIQVGAMGILLSHTPKDAEVLQAVQDFASRPLEPIARMHIVDVVGLTGANDPRIQEIVFRSLADRDPGVKLSGIKALNRMGKGALTKAEPQLRKLAESSHEHPEVKAAAAKALKSLQGETH